MDSSFFHHRMNDSSPVFGSWPQVILYGDSITQMSFSQRGCWGSIVADNLQRKVDVLNRGFSGYTTRNCRSLLPLLFNSTSVSRIVAFVIFLGANDASDPTLNPIQGVPIEEYTRNLTAMVNYLETIGVDGEKLIFITPTPLDEVKWNEECTRSGRVNSKSSQLTAEYATACAHLARNMKVDILNIHDEMLKVPGWPMFLSDGLHLSHEGGEFLANHLLPLLKKRTEFLPIIGPYWQDFNQGDPTSTFLAHRK